MPRVIIENEPFIDPLAASPWFRGAWPGNWVDLPGRPLDAPSMAFFRLPFRVENGATVRVHVSADNRYRLFLDGAQVGEGPERGDPHHWRFETYDLELAPGEHMLTAQSWWLGKAAPYAQMSVRPGFMLAAEGELHEALTTGIARWEGLLVDGFTLGDWGCDSFFVAGPDTRLDGAAYPWQAQAGGGEGWRETAAIAPIVSSLYRMEKPPCWWVTPAMLPVQIDVARSAGRVRFITDGQNAYPVDLTSHLAAEEAGWQGALEGESPLIIPAHSTRTAILELDDYYCAYPTARISGGRGAQISLTWSEALQCDEKGDRKGRRDEIAGKYLRGPRDTFLPDGGEGREFQPVWWRAGRYIVVKVTTADEPLTLESIAIRETRYPLEWEGEFSASDESLARIIPPAVRTLQMCAHETYMDCPFYEQLMYVGDTRLEVLTTYVITADSRLPKKALVTFDHSRMLNGLTQSRYPSALAQIIPPFSLWWVCMAHDYWLWRDDPATVAALLPGMRAVLDYFRSIMLPEGIVGIPNGWNFVDWVPEWEAGVPRPIEETSALFSLQFLHALQKKAELEEYFGESLLAARDRELADGLRAGIFRVFWDERRGLLANDPAHEFFSEHAQSLALLAGAPEPFRARMIDGLLTADLQRTTIYFTHYLFEALALLDRADVLLDRLSLWRAFVENGAKTLLEMPEPSRSDCHAWSSHPLYHYQATLLGIRPGGAGFQTVEITPRPGPLRRISGTLPHPKGQISLQLEREGDKLRGEIKLPEGVSGGINWRGERREVRGGGTEFEMG